MIKRTLLFCALAALTACGAVGTVGDAAIGTGQVVLGAADLLV